MARGRFSNGAFNLLSMFRRSSRRSKFAEEVQPAFDSDTRAFSILPLSSYKKDEDGAGPRTDSADTQAFDDSNSSDESHPFQIDHGDDVDGAETDDVGALTLMSSQRSTQSSQNPWALLAALYDDRKSFKRNQEQAQAESNTEQRLQSAQSFMQRMSELREARGLPRAPLVPSIGVPEASPPPEQQGRRPSRPEVASPSRMPGRAPSPSRSPGPDASPSPRIPSPTLFSRPK